MIVVLQSLAPPGAEFAMVSSNARGHWLSVTPVVWPLVGRGARAGGEGLRR
jgi:hypothetical protein